MTVFHQQHLKCRRGCANFFSFLINIPAVFGIIRINFLKMVGIIADFLGQKIQVASVAVSPKIKNFMRLRIAARDFHALVKNISRVSGAIKVFGIAVCLAWKMFKSG